MPISLATLSEIPFDPSFAPFMDFELNTLRMAFLNRIQVLENFVGFFASPSGATDALENEDPEQETESIRDAQSAGDDADGDDVAVDDAGGEDESDDDDADAGEADDAGGEDESDDDDDAGEADDAGGEDESDDDDAEKADDAGGEDDDFEDD